MKVSPHKHIACKFNVTLSPTCIYDAEPVKNQQGSVEVKVTKTLSVIVDEKQLTLLEE